MACPFCLIDNVWIRRRMFYRGVNWYAILAAPFHTKGHSILAALPPKSRKCPTEPSAEVLNGLSTALVNTIRIINSYYKPKDVLLSSLRGSEGHFHIHLIPLWENEEHTWRNRQTYNYGESYRVGHLMEFLGYMEQTASSRDENERRTKHWDEETQRQHIIISLEQQIREIKKAAHQLGLLNDV